MLQLLKSINRVIVAFSVDRLLAIRSPLHHQMSNVKRSTMIAWGIVTAAVLITSCRLADYYWWWTVYYTGGPNPIRPMGLRTWKTSYVLALVQYIYCVS